MQPTPAEFLAFARKYYPDIYTVVAEQHMAMPRNLGDDLPMNWENLPSSTVSFLSDLANKILEFQRARDLQRINLQRASQSLPPLGPDFRPISDGGPLSNLTGGSGGDAGGMLVLAALAAGAVGYMVAKKK